MRVLVISIDRTLLGADYSGDVLERHQKYAREAGSLDVIVMSTKGFKKKEIDSHLAVFPTNSKSKLTYVFDALEIAKNIYWPNKIDLIVCQDPFLTGLAGWLIKKRFKIPLLIHFHGDFWDNKYWLLEKSRWWFNWFLFLLSKFLVPRADGIRVVSSGIRDKLIKGGVSGEKIRVIPTPVDLKKFERFDEKKVKNLKERIHKNWKTIINVGRKDSAKDYSTLFKAIKLVHEKYGKLAFCQIGADIRLSDKIRLDDSIKLTSIGKISQEELVNYYHASDIYVSSSKHESFGKVLIEALTAGLPVVATATTGSKEIIKDGINGFLVPVSDAQVLARRILDLLNNPQKAKQMGQAGKQMARERFNQEKVIREIIRFWKDLI